MGNKGFSRLLPAYIPLIVGFLKHFLRDNKHNNNIKKTDQTAEKIATVEHLLVRLEKKVQQNREVYLKAGMRIQIWLWINTALLVAILIKLLGLF